MSFSVWGVAIRGSDRGDWVMCYRFEEMDLAYAVAKQRKDLWPLQVRDDSKKDTRREGVLETFVHY